MKWITSLRLAIVILLLFVNHALAQFQPTGGPSGGGVHIYDLIEWEGSWYAAANDYLLRSNDQGNSWQLVSEGLPELKIQARSFAAFDGYLYVSTNSQYRMLRSNDNGNTWELVNNNLPSLFGIPIFLAQKMLVNNGRLLALPLGTDPLFYLEEGSNSWNPSDFRGVGGNGIAHISGDTLFASIGSDLKMSVDNGQSWTDFPAKPSVALGGVGATDFLKAGNRIILTTNAGGNNGLFYSDDSLQTWTAPAVSFFSGNAGKNKMLYLADDNILALSGSGIMRSADQGESWEEITTENTRPAGLTVFIKQLSNGQIAVGTTSGLYLYDDQGAGASTELSLGIGRADLYQTKVFNGELISLHDGYISSYSTENGWQRLVDIRDLGIEVSGYSGIYTLGDQLVLIGQNKAYISTDGSNFEQMDLPDGLIPVAFHEHADRWFMVTGIPGGFNNWVGGAVYLSDNQGEEWTQASVPDFPTGSSFGPLFFSHYLEVINEHLFMVGRDRILRSADNGESWTVLNPGTGVRLMLFDFDNELFLCSDESKIHKSTDNGDSWQVWYGGLPSSNAFSRQLHGMVRLGDRLITYNDPSQFVTPASQEKGFFELTSASGEWSYLPELEGLSFIPSGLLGYQGRILAYLTDIGYWISEQLTTTSIEGEPENLPNGFILHQNYPNPFNPTTTIAFTLPESASIEVRIYNAMGQQVNALTAGRLNAGSHSIAFEAGTFSSGIYFYQLIADGLAVQTRRMTLIK